MKCLRFAILTLLLILLFGCSGPSLLDESQKTFYGIVIECAMSSVSTYKYGREYTTIALSSGEEMCFWSYDENSRPESINVGDFVRVESAIEADSNLLVAIEITKLITDSCSSRNMEMDWADPKYCEHSDSGLI